MRHATPRSLLPLVTTGALLLGGCASDGQSWLFGAEGDTRKAEATSASPQRDDYYAAHVDGRIYLFDDFDTYSAFLEHGETPYRYMRIGDGPHGETLVFGLSAENKTLGAETPAALMYDGKLSGAEKGFYAEVLHENRFYVFDRWEDLQGFRSTHEAPYRYTEIGEGPGGRTVVYVLNSHNKTEKPAALVARFKGLHGQAAAPEEPSDMPTKRLIGQ